MDCPTSRFSGPEARVARLPGAERHVGQTCDELRIVMGLTQTELVDRTNEAPRADRDSGNLAGRVAVGCTRTTAGQNRTPRYLGIGSPSNAASVVRVEALRTGLRDLGHVEGKNLVIEFRWADTVEQLRDGAAELVRMKVDVIYAPSSTESEPARRATNTIPIVFSTHFDPVGVGHVASLARPGGNITGVAALGTELAAKQLELLKQPCRARRGSASSTRPPHPRTGPSFKPPRRPEGHSIFSF